MPWDKNLEHSIEHSTNTENAEAVREKDSSLQQEQLEQVHQLQRADDAKSVEQGMTKENYKAKVEALKHQIESQKLTKEQMDNLYREYDALTKKYDAHAGTTEQVSTFTEDISHAMGIRDKVTDNRNIKNTLLWVGGAAAVWWVASKRKSRFGKNDEVQDEEDWEEEERDEETPKAKKKRKKSRSDTDSWEEKKSRFARNWGWVLWGTAGLAGVWYLFRDSLYKIPWLGPKLDSLFNKRLSMEEAMNLVQGNMLKAHEAHLTKVERAEMTWDAKNSKLNIFGHDIPVDVEAKKIQWLNIQFQTFEELITTAWIIAALKYEFAGKSDFEKPFNISAHGGDIEIYLSEGKEVDAVSGQYDFPVATVAGGIVGGTLWGFLWSYLWPKGTIFGAWAGAIAWGTGGHMLDSNDTLSRVAQVINQWDNKKLLNSYLNGLGWWKKWLQQNTADAMKTDSAEVNEIGKEVLDQIQATVNEEDDDTKHGGERQMTLKNHPQHKNLIQLSSYKNVVYLTPTLDNQWTVTGMQVEDLGLTFTGREWIAEAIRIANLTNFLIDKYQGKGDSIKPFEYKGFLWMAKWLYFDKPWSGYDRVLEEETISKRFPQLADENKRQKYIDWLNGMKTDVKSLWTDTSGSARYNVFLTQLDAKKAA